MGNGASPIGGTHSVRLGERPALGGTTGSFRGLSVEAAPAQPRAASALRTAWLEVRHFLTSLVGLRVSTDKPARVDDAQSATRGVLHAMTKRDLDALDVVGALSDLLAHGGFSEDEARAGLSDEATALFRPALRDLTDMQLVRLHGNFARRPELRERLAQEGSAAVVESVDDDVPTAEVMRGGGKVNDLGFLNLALCACARDELQARGFAMDDLPEDAAAADRGVELFAREAVANGGDLAAALRSARGQRAQEEHDARLAALESTGLYTREAPATPVTTPPPAAPAFSPAVNAGVSAPFDAALSAMLVGRLNTNIAPDALEETPVTGLPGTRVAEIFAKDVNRAEGPMTLAGAPVPGLKEAGQSSAGNPGDAPRLKLWCAALQAAGLSADDVMTLSRLANQSTLAIVLRADQPDLLPTLRTPDGRSAAVMPTVPDRSWDVVPRRDGVDLVFDGRGDLAYLPATDGTTIMLGSGSEAALRFTLALDRDADGRLALTGLRDASLQVAAFAEDGQRIA